MNEQNTGEVSLPVACHKQEIVDAVKHHDVVVITAETGAGKSTLVPQYLLEEGYRMAVTQPRRLAARTIAAFVAGMIDEPLGGIVGYRTAHEAEDSDRTRILYCTDGLELVRELAGHGAKDVLIIDEVHEWNTNIETLVAWAREQKKSGWPTKVVIMSATLEADRLARFFGGVVPVICVSGRSYPVKTSRDRADALVSRVRSLVRDKKNVLVFQPGKREIKDTIEDLKGCGAVVLPLYADLSVEEQDRCFMRYDLPKVIVATNIAQTSITVSDIDAVVDSGEERTVDLHNDIEGLYLRPVSRADLQQRKGRAGRTRPGVYVLCSDVPMRERPMFPKAEIERTRLDQLVLRLMAVDIDATKLRFLHQPDFAVLRDAKQMLRMLGAITKNDRVTDIGYAMADLPVSVRSARMLIEAKKLGALDQAITLAAIREVGGLRDSDTPVYESSEGIADVFVELELWAACETMIREETTFDPGRFGVSEKAYLKAKEIREELISRMGDPRPFSFGGRKDLLRAYVSGMVDLVYRRGRVSTTYRGADERVRELSRESALLGCAADLVVGLPIDIEYRDRWGRMCLAHLLTAAAKVTPTLLVSCAPHLVETRSEYRYVRGRRKRRRVSYTVTYMNGVEIMRSSP